MKIGIMQPYFFPYLGYFQLIDAVDTYVNLDHVSFMKRSYMTRNTLKNSTRINLQISDASQNKSCRDVLVNFDHDYLSKTLKTINNLYSGSPYFNEIQNQIIQPNFIDRKINVSDFNLNLIKSICEYLKIETEIIDSSSDFKSSGLKKELGLQGITNELGGDIYINAIGGIKLYDKENFKDSGIELKFIQSQKLDFENPYLSVLHQLMNYSQEHISGEIKKYDLI